MKTYRSLIAASLMLAALVPLQTHAADNTWLNTSADFSWNNASVNWTSPTVWADGDNAIFGTTGAGTVTLGTAITAGSISNTVGEYIFDAPGGSTLTLSNTTPSISVGATNLFLRVSLQGTNGLTVLATTPTNKLTLAGNNVFGQGNNYTGGTYVRSGTVEMNADNANGASQYAIDSIEALDAGATVKFFNDTDGINNIRVSQNGQIQRGAAPYAGKRIVMTGGTFDVCGDDNRNQVPIVQGTGTVRNSSTNSRAVLKMVADAGTFTFSGILADGGPIFASVVSGKVSHRLDIDLQDAQSGTVWVLAGANTYSGSTRRGSGIIRLSGAGTLGIPTTNTPAVGLRVNGGDGDPVLIDLNATSQRVSGIGGGGGLIGNTAAATTSVLTVGMVDGSTDTGTPSWNGKLVDGGGVLALTKVGTNTQAFGGSGHTYSGDTTVSNGILAYTTVTAISSNSTIRLFTSQGNLGLSYAGTAPVKQLAINGVQMPNGTYGASTPPIASTGFIKVIGSTVQPALSTSVSGGSITFSWPGGVGSFKLQTQTNSASVGITGTWFDYPGGGSNPVIVPIDPANPTVFFRLAPAP